MSQVRNDGGPVFPCRIENRSDADKHLPVGEVIPAGTALCWPGMTLRDYFAAKAMQALLPIYEHNPSFDLSERAYASADAMLKARRS